MVALSHEKDKLINFGWKSTSSQSKNLKALLPFSVLFSVLSKNNSWIVGWI